MMNKLSIALIAKTMYISFKDLKTNLVNIGTYS
jgi:hypothetical protein